MATFWLLTCNVRKSKIRICDLNLMSGMHSGILYGRTRNKLEWALVVYHMHTALADAELKYELVSGNLMIRAIPAILHGHGRSLERFCAFAAILSSDTADCITEGRRVGIEKIPALNLFHTSLHPPLFRMVAFCVGCLSL